MNYLPKLGNIKIGGTENGLPKQFSTLKVTKCSKNGEENFELHEDFPNEMKSINILLPFFDNIHNNFETGLISFILVNDTMKYYAKDIEGEIFLFPLQPNMQNPLIPLPVIKLGETSKWEHKLGLRERGLLYAYIPREDNVFDYVGGATGVFLFKTESAYTISEIKNTLSIIDSIVNELKTTEIRHIPLKLEIHSKLVKLGDIEEVTYARLLPPNIKSFMDLKEVNFKTASVILGAIERNVVSSKEKAIKEAVNIEEANKFFGKKIVLKIDTSDSLDMSASKPETASAEIMQKAEVLAKDFGLPMPIMTALVKKAGDSATAMIEKHKTVEGLIKYIGERS